MEKDDFFTYNDFFIIAPFYQVFELCFDLILKSNKTKV